MHRGQPGRSLPNATLPEYPLAPLTVPNVKKISVACYFCQYVFNVNALGSVQQNNAFN